MIYKATRSDRPFGFVVVHSLSRFSRDALHSEVYVRKLRKAGVELVSVTQAVSADTSGEMYRKLLNIFDEHQSLENAKHVHRAMCENTRQGFWNGARPPFGYAVKVAERRGNKDKKVLIVDEAEARVVKIIFDMAIGVNGRPLGVKAIALWLNERGYTRRGVRFSTGSIHEILTSPTYFGQHYFNRRDSRKQQSRPPSQWVSLAVPAILTEETFNAVQALLQSRSPRRVPPRVVNGPTLLAGLIRCGYCDAAMIQNTGKGGQYRYYCCSKRLKEGPMSCEGVRLPMERLDDLVMGEIAKRVLDPQRLTAMLQRYIALASERDGHSKERLARHRRDHAEAKAGITRLLELTEKGVMDVEDPELRERLIGLKLKRDELAGQIADLQKQMASSEPTITPEKIERLIKLLRDKLFGPEPDVRQAYARLVMSEVKVTKEEVRISGSNATLARAASHGTEIPAPAVLSFVREWRTRHDSNV
jgi:site-specific DNA recombinase